MSDRQKLLAITIFCYIVGIIIIVSGIINPDIFDYSSILWDWGRGYYIAMGFFWGVVFLGAGILLTLILWGSK